MRSALMVIAAALLGVSFAQGTGRLALDPVSGTVGTTVVGTATGLAPGQEVELVWMSADASWNVGEGTFHGVVAEETRSVVGTGTVGDDGSVDFEFVVPDDYGYVHNVFVESGGEQVARQGFTVAPSLSISPTSGPVGTPITVTMKGVGYRFWESVWHLLYDGAHTGWVSAITTNGTAVFTLPATGEVGLHTLQAISGTHPVPYLNQQQSPNYKPAVPTVVSALFEVTEGPAVAPSAPETQVLGRDAAVTSQGDGPSLSLDHGSGIVGSPVVATGAGFPANATVELMWSTVTGNRISGAGWEEVESSLASVDTDADGAFTLTFETPDDLGGGHTLRAVSGDAQASVAYVITPSVALIEPQIVEPGGDITITIKGVGWTQTANIYTVLIDNGYVGYGCGFNSQGDVTMYLKAPGRVGTHFITIYPSIYQGEVTSPGGPSTPDANATFLQLPMLNHVDHPGEELPAFTLSFEVRAP
ncbi:MAG TPA: hypothetical protein VFF10_06325 [Trueperaceae bacterium]|nr:hypothetical protein [Trueperaceae bacterium]